MQSHSIGAPGSPARLKQQQEDLPDAQPSPRRNPPQVYMRQYKELEKAVGPHGGLDTPVFELTHLVGTLMHDVGTECAKAGLPGKEEAMKEICRHISTSILSAESCFDRCEFDAVQTHLLAAKGNQVKLLGQIDGLKQDADGDQEFSQPRVTCENVGIRISLLMKLVQERTNQHAKASRHPDSRPLSPRQNATSGQRSKAERAAERDRSQSPEPDSRAENPAPEKQARSPGKRAQDDQDSPQMKNSPAKRHKPESGQADATPLSPSRQRATASTASASISVKPAPLVAPTSGTAVMPSGSGSTSTSTSTSISISKPTWKARKPADNLTPHPLPTTPRSPGRSQESATTGPRHERLPAESVATGDIAANNDTAREPATASASGNPEADLQSQVTSKEQRPTSPRRGGAKLTSPGPRPRPPSALFAAPVSFSTGGEQAPKSPRSPQKRLASMEGAPQAPLQQQQQQQQPSSDSASNSHS